jgi:hypothetical protein
MKSHHQTAQPYHDDAFPQRKNKRGGQHLQHESRPPAAKFPAQPPLGKPACVNAAGPSATRVTSSTSMSGHLKGILGGASAYRGMRG